MEYKYDLFAVSNHYGSLGGGHYTAYAKNPIYKKWYFLSKEILHHRYDFNDSCVSPVKSSSVVSESAYVLFYRRKDSPICRL
jgi:ubiquitin carboxyl-terminal hydrolase 4/11/15